jgi:hypothetical protein
MLQLVQLVEEKITIELKQTKHGAIMHDRWTKNGTNYVGIFECHNRMVEIFKAGKFSEGLEPTITLLSMAPLPASSIGGCFSCDSVERLKAIDHWLGMVSGAFEEGMIVVPRSILKVGHDFLSHGV